MSDRKIMVSVLCTTYNHERYIRQALDGFIAQKTDFEYEILVHDDASTDGTQSILKEYESKYPEKIKVIYRKKNLYSQGIRNMIMRYLLPRASGKYVAFCEGDDYWTDNDKLQRQVDYLENHKDVALCFHPVVVKFEHNNEKSSIFPKETDVNKFTLKDLLKNNFIQINSVMYRKQKYKDMSLDIMPGDWYLHLYHAKFGGIGFINKPMAVYRRHSAGIWWQSYSDKTKFWEDQGPNHINLFSTLLKMFGTNEKYGEIIHSALNNVVDTLVDIDLSKGTNIANEAFRKYPEALEDYLKGERKKLISLQHKNNDLIAENERLKNQVNSLSEELDEIRSSKGWRMLEKVYRAKANISRLLSRK